MTLGKLDERELVHHEFIGYKSSEWVNFLNEVLPLLDIGLEHFQPKKHLVLDECVYCCQFLYTPPGLYMNLRNNDAVCLHHLTLDTALTGCPLYLRYQAQWSLRSTSGETLDTQTWSTDVPSNNSRVSVNTSSLICGYILSLCWINDKRELRQYPLHDATEIFDDKAFDAMCSLLMVSCRHVKSALQQGWNYCKRKDFRGVVTWDKEVMSNPRIEKLEQIPHPPVLDPQNLHCAECGRTSNLWLHLADGFVGCGRKLFGVPDSGCLNGEEGAAVRHYHENRETCFLAAKVGTFSSPCVDVYSYVDDAMLDDPWIDRHLAHFGIRKDEVSVNEKSLAELELDYNQNYDWSHRQDSTDLLLCGPGLVGLGNFGNTCYMNVVLQLLARVSPLQAMADLGRFHDEIWRCLPSLKNVKFIPFPLALYIKDVTETLQ